MVFGDDELTYASSMGFKVIFRSVVDAVDAKTLVPTMLLRKASKSSRTADRIAKRWTLFTIKFPS